MKIKLSLESKKYRYNINNSYHKLYNLLITIKNKTLFSEFNQSVLKLVTGTGIAQLIAIALSPILTRVYTPTDFGQFGLYMSILAILSVGITGRYELALMLPKSHRKASQLLALCLILTLFFTTLASIGIITYKYTLSHTYPLENWIYVLPLGILFTGFFNCLSYWTNRLKEYKTLATTTITQKLSSNAIQIGSGLLLSASI